MINDSETLTGGIHQVLYGGLKPDRVLERYQSYLSDCELYHLLTQFPESPLAYLSVHKNISSRWESFYQKRAEDDIQHGWLPAFYVVQPADEADVTHMLCDFYRLFIRAECRMIIEVSESMKSSLELFTLTYELLTLRDELIELIREASFRLNNSLPEAISGDLSRYVLSQIQFHLPPTLFELQIRSSHLLEERVVSERKLYLNFLNQPVPKKTAWYRSTALTRFELELALRSPSPDDQLSSVEALLMQIRNNHSVHENEELQDSINLLENTWFCLFMSNKTGRWSAIDLNEPNRCLQAIEKIHQKLFDHPGTYEDSASGQIVQAVIESFDYIQSVLPVSAPDRWSAAKRLIQSIESYYTGSNNWEDLPAMQTSVKAAQVVRETTKLSVLDQYILIDDLKDKLDVTQKSLNAYLSDCKTPIYKFSNKTRLIHIDDLTAMMDYFKTTL